MQQIVNNFKSYARNTSKDSIVLRYIAFWSPVLYLLVTTTRLLYFWEEKESAFDQNLENGNELISFIGIIILLIILPGLFKKRFQILSILSYIWPLLLLFFFALLSCSWSSVPFMSFRRWLKVGIIALCLLNCFLEDRTGNLLKKSIYTYLSITLFLSLFFIIFLPHYSWHEYQDYLLPCGIMAHKNSLGQLSAITCLLSLSFLSPLNHFRSKIRYLIPVIISFSILILSQAMTAIAGFLLSLLIIFFFVLIRKLKVMKLFIAASFLFLYVIMIVLILNSGNNFQSVFSGVVSLFGKDMTFTGRTAMWDILLHLGLNSHPLLGSGYGSFFLGEKSSWLLTYIDWEATHAHNGFLMIFLELGIIGIFLICLFLTSIAISLHRNNQSNLTDRLALTGTFIFIVFNNFFESELMTTSLVFSIIIFLSIFNSRSFYQSRSEICL